jgi:hypothetical protein
MHGLALLRQFFELAFEVILDGFEGSSVDLGGVAHVLIMYLVEPPHLMLLFLVEIVPLPDLHLIGGHRDLFLLTLLDHVFLLVLEQLDLRLSVQLIDPHTSNLVIQILVLHLLLLDVLRDLLSLLEQIHRCLLDGCMLTFAVYQLFHELFGLSVQLHDVRLDHVHLLLYVLLIDVGLLSFCLCSTERFRE